MVFVTALNKTVSDPAGNGTGAKALTANLADALIAFQAAVPTIHENDSSFHGKFANLPGILSTINPVLRSVGLAVSQLPADTAEGPGLRTTLLHTSGESLSAVTPLCIQEGLDSKGRPLNVTQEWGKAVTYTRRYALQAVLGICVGIEDNDADAEPTGFAPPAKAAPKAEKKAPEPAKFTAADRQQCVDIIKGEGGQDIKNKFMAKFYPEAENLFPEMFEKQEHLNFLTSCNGAAI